MHRPLSLQAAGIACFRVAVLGRLCCTFGRRRQGPLPVAAPCPRRTLVHRRRGCSGSDRQALSHACFPSAVTAHDPICSSCASMHSSSQAAPLLVPAPAHALCDTGCTVFELMAVVCGHRNSCAANRCWLHWSSWRACCDQQRRRHHHHSSYASGCLPPPGAGSAYVQTTSSAQSLVHVVDRIPKERLGTLQGTSILQVFWRISSAAGCVHAGSSHQ